MNLLAQVALSAAFAWFALPLLAGPAQASAEPGATAELTPSTDTLAFRVMRDDKVVGHHVVRFAQEPDGALVVEIDIALKVKLGFITLYDYSHRNREVWRNGELASLASETDDNGKPKKLTVERKSDGWHVAGTGFTGVLTDPVMTTSYWSPTTVQYRVLLDSQDGDQLAITIADEGTDELTLLGVRVPARHYVMSGDLRKELWYDAEGRWVRSTFRVFGQNFSYDLVSLPSPLQQTVQVR